MSAPGNPEKASDNVKPLHRRDLTGAVLSHLWSRRIFIIKVMAIAIVAFTVVLLLIPNKFRAQATIIILPPRFQSEIRTEPLTVGTAKSLLGAGDLIEQVIERIKTAKRIVDDWSKSHGGNDKSLDAFAAMDQAEISQKSGATDDAFAIYLNSLSLNELKALRDFKLTELNDLTVQDLSKALDCEDMVEKKTASDVKFSPLLTLDAIADTGSKAQLFANTWASVFERKYNEITNQKSTRQYESIKRLQAESQLALVDVQTSVVQFKALHNLDLYQKQIDEYSESFRKFTNQLTEKNNDLKQEKAKLAELYNIVNAMESHGEWLGHLPTSNLGNFTTGTDLLSVNRSGDSGGQPFPTALRGDVSETSGSLEETTGSLSPAYRNIREKTLESRDELINAMRKANSFYLASPVELLEKQKDQVQTDYLAAESKYRTGTMRLAAQEKTLQELDERLSSTQQSIRLIKSVPDIVIAEAMATRKNSLEGLSRVQFEEQEINPAWSNIVITRDTREQEVNALRNELDQLAATLPDKQAQLEKLQNAVYWARLGENRVKDDLTRWEQVNSEYFKNYFETKNNMYNAEGRIRLLEVEVGQLEARTSETKALVESYQEMYNSSAAELQLLEGRQRAVERNANLLLEKLQAAQLAVRQEVSDVSVAASAVTPDKHFFPRRSVFLLVFTFVVGLVLLGAMARAKYLELLDA